jgi:hypothetical protein
MKPAWKFAVGCSVGATLVIAALGFHLGNKPEQQLSPALRIIKDATRPMDLPKPPMPTPAPAVIEVPEPVPPPPTRILRYSELTYLPSDETDRIPAARERSEQPIRELFAEAGAKYPAHELYLRAFKRERELEMWARASDGPWTLVITYAIAGASGGPGPKRREGDRQVPEGFYEINRFNPKSNFHLSMGLNYPNEADRILGDPEKPGYDIFLHGRDSSIGCMAMGDDRIEEIYLAAADSAERPIRVHIFPARMDSPDWEKWRDEQVTARPDVAALWHDLHSGWQIFERHGVVPEVGVRPDGRYDLTFP